MSAPTVIDTNVVATITYVLTGNKGEVLQSAGAEDAHPHLQGHDALPPEVEEALQGKSAGDKVQVVISKEQGALYFGERIEGNYQSFPANLIPEGMNITEGQQIAADLGEGVGFFTVTKVTEDEITIDLNDPWAGHELTWDIQILELRAATESEIAHGHVHGPGCNH